MLDSLGRTALALIAAHGTFRADNPQFSLGWLLPVGADELLGLTTALIPLGTAGIAASPVPINDAATVPLMVALHRSLSAGANCAHALHEARRATSGDPVHRATGLSFVAPGAG